MPIGKVISFGFKFLFVSINFKAPLLEFKFSKEVSQYYSIHISVAQYDS